MKRLFARYKALPKWFRFVFQYGTAPIWFPIVLVLGAVGMITLLPLVVISEAWESFE